MVRFSFAEISTQDFHALTSASKISSSSGPRG